MIKSKFDVSVRVWAVVLMFVLFALLSVIGAVVHTYIIIPEAVAEEFMAKWTYQCPGWETKFVLYLKDSGNDWAEIQEFVSRCDDGEVGAKNFEETFTCDVVPGRSYTFGLVAKNADSESDKAEATVYVPCPKPAMPEGFIILLLED